MRYLSSIEYIARKSIHRSAAAARRFFDGERGSLTGFSLYILSAMVLMAYFAIDIMRYEGIRSRLQSTTDRAALAAADLDQTAPARDVVQDYFDKAGLGEYLTGVGVKKGLNFKTVDVQVDVTMGKWMNGLFDDDAGAPVAIRAYSQAEERIQNIEVSLVLDISGSMGSNRKIQNLRAAADQFVRTMMENNTEVLDDGTGLTSVSIIPYHAVVNVPDEIMDQIHVRDYQEYSNCVRFSNSDFSTTALRNTPAFGAMSNQEYDRIGHFDRNNSRLYTSNGKPRIRSPWCQSSSYGEILPHSVSVDDLTDKIAELGAGGNTAIDLGMKWAAALIDPSTRPMTNAMIARNDLDSAVEDRPVDYGDEETIKVIVLMTDGKNTTQYDLKSDYKDSDSNVYYSEDQNKYSVYVPSRSGRYKWWDPQRDRWRTSKIGSDAEKMSHTELFRRFSVRYAADYFYYGADNNMRNRYRSAWYGYTGSSSADSNTRRLCDQLKDEKVVIFTIGFEAPTQGQDLMRYCASTSGHYFDVQGVEISEAFSSIANTIQQLRLTL